MYFHQITYFLPNMFNYFVNTFIKYQTTLQSLGPKLNYRKSEIIHKILLISLFLCSFKYHHNEATGPSNSCIAFSHLISRFLPLVFEHLSECETSAGCFAFVRYVITYINYYNSFKSQNTFFFTEM